ncbi:MAG TPA: POTRA domain-containing protein [Terriglobia bacterium]|nr:POTRA domain-containing protein [Terriglobia bacterium]
MKVRDLILVLFLPSLAQAQEQYYGTRVSGIAVSGSASQADLATLPIRVGDTLTPQNVRTVIEALYNTGQYSYVDADANVVADGTTSLTFRVRPFFFFSTFRLEPENLLDRSLSAYFRLPFGEKFATSAVERVVENTRDLLISEGYFQATVTPTYRPDEQSHLIFVTLKVTPGPKAKVGTVRVQGGEQTFKPEELLDAFGLKTGDDVSGSKIDKGVSDVRAKFTELRFLNTRVTVDRMYDAATNTVDMNVMIQPGQFALVQPRGFNISNKKLRELIPIYEEAAVDPDLVEEGRVRVMRYMQQEGYFDAIVGAETIEVDPNLGNAIQINYTIMPGAKHEIVGVRIDGNQYFTTDEIRRRMKSRKGEWLNRGVFSADILEEDRQTIEAMYRNAGFEGTVVIATPEDADHAITVVIRIVEGKRLPIEAIDFAGNNRISSKELREALGIKEGDTYTPGAVDEARAALTRFYYSRGYADARVERTVERIESNNGMRVSFQITEGATYIIGSILVAGNTITKDKVIRRSSRLQEYKPYDPEMILAAQQRLYATGLFSRVEVVPLDQGLVGIRNVLIQVEDAKPILLTYGVGYQEFEQARGSFEISHNNLFGLNRSISFRTRMSYRERLGQATYREPRLFNHELDGFASSFIEHSERPFYTADRIDFSLQALKRFSVQNNFLITSSYQTVDIGDIGVNPHAPTNPNDPSVTSQIGPCKICQIGRLGVSLVTDHRNDPVNPTTGSFSTTTFQVANGIFGSELDFTSLFNQSSHYFPVADGVLATSGRFGWNHPYGRTAAFAPGQRQQLPATERYFAGGSTTLRGFGLDEARPPSIPDLQGGNVLTIGNIEYRVPLRAFPLSGLWGAVFYDTGNVFPSIPDVHLSEFTHTAGFGFRYQTPVGPARLDFGINLRPERRPDGTLEPRLKISFTLGNPF